MSVIAKPSGIPFLPGIGVAGAPPITLTGTIPELTQGQPFSFDLHLDGGSDDFVSAASSNKPAWMTIAFVEPDIVRFSGASAQL